MELIHSDCLDPGAEVDGWISQLITEARDAGISDREVAQVLRQAAGELAAGAR